MIPRTVAPPAGRVPRLFGFGRAFARESGNFTWVYLWGSPIRFMHWIAAAAIVLLVASGFYVGRPYIGTTGDASAHFLMGWIRFLHFTAAAVLVMTGIVRVYWLFAGNQYERLAALFPVTRRNLQNFVRTFLAYLTFTPERAPNFVGHNPLQQFSYTGTYLLTIVMVATGFTLYGQSNPGGLIHLSFGWVTALLGGLQNVRLVHHAGTYGFAIFVILHVYFAIRADYVERTGAVSSILTGGRYISLDQPYEDFDPDKVPSRPWPTGEFKVPPA